MGINYENLKTVLQYMLGLIKTQNARISEIDSREFFTEERINLLVANNDDVMSCASRLDAQNKRLDEVNGDRQLGTSELESLKLRVTEVGNKSESNKTKLQALDDKLQDTAVELSKKVESNESRVVSLEESTITQNERLDEIDRYLEDMRRDFDDVTNAATTGKSVSVGMGGGSNVRTIEAMSKVRELESKVKEISLKLDVSTDAFTDQFNKNKEIMDRASLDSQNSLVLAQSNRERLDEQLKMVRLVQDELNEKVNADDFDVFRQQLNTGGVSQEGSVGTGVPMIPTKELNTIKDNAKRLDFLEQEVSSFKSRSQNHFRDINDKLTLINNELADKLEQATINLVKESVAINRNEIDRLKDWVEQLENRPPIITTNAPSAPQDTAKCMSLLSRWMNSSEKYNAPEA